MLFRRFFFNSLICWIFHRSHISHTLEMHIYWKITIVLAEAASEYSFSCHVLYDRSAHYGVVLSALRPTFLAAGFLITWFSNKPPDKTYIISNKNNSSPSSWLPLFSLRFVHCVLYLPINLISTIITVTVIESLPRWCSGQFIVCRIQGPISHSGGIFFWPTSTENNPTNKQNGYTGFPKTKAARTGASSLRQLL